MQDLYNKNNNFDDIVLLGYNCQLAYAFEAVFGQRLDSNFFNWVYILNSIYIADFLYEPDKIHTNKLDFRSDCMMYEDENFKFRYHTKFDKDVMKSVDSEHLKEIIKEDTKEITSRMSHLKDKFVSLIKSGKRLLFVCCINPKENPDNINEIVSKIFEALSETVKNKDFELAVIIKEDILKNLALKNIKQVKYLSIPDFPTDVDAHKIDTNWWLGFYSSYNFSKYYIKNAKRNIKKYLNKHDENYNSFLENIFSIKNKKINDKKYKCITILWLKFKKRKI
jgi:hypothetical protein